MFSITDHAINVGALRRPLSNVHAGALASFEGIVRASNEGQQVVSLLYEAYEPLALAEGNSIIEEAKHSFAILDCLCCHRIGLLGVGELAVYVAVSAVHRDAAFAACRFIIDQVKERVPIWKQETLSDGKKVWVNCTHGSGEQHAGPSAGEDGSKKLSIELAQDFDGDRKQLFELDILELSSSELANYQLVDIRESDEEQSCLLLNLLPGDVLRIPSSNFQTADPPIDRQRQYLFISQDGQRSFKLAAALRERGFANTWSLKGGVEAVRRKYIA